MFTVSIIEHSVNKLESHNWCYDEATSNCQHLTDTSFRHLYIMCCMNYVSLYFHLRNMMCHTFLLRECQSGGELGQMQLHTSKNRQQQTIRFLYLFFFKKPMSFGHLEKIKQYWCSSCHSSHHSQRKLCNCQRYTSSWCTGSKHPLGWWKMRRELFGNGRGQPRLFAEWDLNLSSKKRKKSCLKLQVPTAVS